VIPRRWVGMVVVGVHTQQLAGFCPRIIPTSPLGWRRRRRSNPMVGWISSSRGSSSSTCLVSSALVSKPNGDGLGLVRVRFLALASSSLATQPNCGFGIVLPRFLALDFVSSSLASQPNCGLGFVLAVPGARITWHRRCPTGLVFESARMYSRGSPHRFYVRGGQWWWRKIRKNKRRGITFVMPRDALRGPPTPWVPPAVCHLISSTSRTGPHPSDEGRGTVCFEFRSCERVRRRRE
jgi:hypothetical protein